jgi:glycosyltransferase involved in cell wall biosynthesis
MVTTFYPPHHFGGDAVFVQRLSRALARRGHSVTVIHDVDAYDLLSGRAPTAPEEGSDGVEVIGLRSGWGALAPLLTQQIGRPVLNAARLRRLFAGRRFDVIHFHNVSLVGGPGILRYGDGVKLYTTHEHWLVCPTHVLWRHNREPCDRRECLRCVLAYRRPPQLWRATGLLERALDCVDAFIAPSEFTRRKHREFGFPKEMEVLPHFLADPATADPAQRAAQPSPHPRPYFLFVGRLETLKGLQTVLPLMDRHVAVDLLVAGDGTYGAELRRQAAGSPRIVFLGRRPCAELDALYRHALALIVPSLGFETFCMVVLEAFRQGTPTLVRRVGPLPEMVEASGGGLIFDDSDGLSEAMARLTADADLRERLGTAGYRAYASRWTESRHLARYLGLVEQIRELKGRTVPGSPPRALLRSSAPQSTSRNGDASPD